MVADNLNQRGPITFDPRTTLQKHDDLRAISNKILQDQKLNKNRFRFASSIYKEQIHKISNKTNSKDKSVRKIANLLQISINGMHVFVDSFAL